MSTLLPGYDRPAPQARVIDRELLRVAQQSARRRRNWECANGLLRMAYGCEEYMHTTRVKAVLLRNGDQIVDVDGLMVISNFQMDTMENIVTYTATKPDGSVSQRWADMDTLFDKVVG
ncbi:TPA: hypothetical protein SIF59_004018 [Escherichia coli]|nr:hypothetical protein [Escherichia coli]HEI0663031.1 hypothetical protein [Escherichia coli]